MPRLPWFGFGGALWLLGGVIIFSTTLLVITVAACSGFIEVSCKKPLIGSIAWFGLITALGIWALSEYVALTHPPSNDDLTT